MKYLLVYYGGATASTPEAQAEVMKTWNAWFKDLGKAVVDGGNPFSGKVKSVSSDGAIGNGSNCQDRLRLQHPRGRLDR